MKNYRIVFHLDEPHRAAVALANIRSLLAAFGAEKVEIELVAYGDGVHALRRESEHVPAIEQIRGDGVRFAVCGNTMRNQHLTREDFPDAVEVVPSGIVELVLRQDAGWCYIRP